MAPSLPRVLLIDEDIGYGRMLMTTASRERMPMSHMRSMHDSSFLMEWRFDVAIVHAEMGLSGGLQLLRSLEPLLDGIPVVLLTDYEVANESDWPDYVKRCVSKTSSYEEILAAAMDAYILARKG